MRRLLPALTVLTLLAAGAVFLIRDLAGAAPPDALAQRLAQALSRHDLDGVPLTDPEDASAHAALVEPLTAHSPDVTAGEVDRDGDRASLTLHWRWGFGGRPWSYDTRAVLVDHGEGWAVEWTPALVEPTLVDGDRLDVAATEADRGRILGADGVQLVTDRPVLRYGLDKSRLEESEVPGSARRVAQALDLDVPAFVARARAAGPRAFVEGIVLRTPDAARLVAPGFADVPGALAVPDELPLAPTRDFAAPLLGTSGPATAEIVEESGGRVGPGDVVGLTGLQRRYDDRLAGRDGVRVRAVPAGTCAEEGCTGTRTLFERPAADGRDLLLTLDADLQQHAEDVLADVEDGASALVAVRPSTGEILAAADGPGNEGLAAATYGRYAPGSTFKVVTTLALMRAGLSPEDAVGCADEVTVDGKRFENYDDYPADQVGTISLTEAVAHSCNTALIAERGRLDDRDLAEAAAALGLGVDHDLGFPAFLGEVPVPEGATEEAAAMIGQGRVLASPLAMATVAASVREGRAVVPRLLGGSTPAARPARPVTEGEAAELRAVMRSVVTDGAGRFLADVPGEVGAKTGTAEYGRPGPDGSLPTHAWMIATRGDLAVAVLVEKGESGSGTAGPLLEAFLR